MSHGWFRAGAAFPLVFFHPSVTQKLCRQSSRQSSRQRWGRTVHRPQSTALALLLLAALAPRAEAADRTWDNGESGDWNDTAHWGGNPYPGAGGTAILTLTSGSYYPVSAVSYTGTVTILPFAGKAWTGNSGTDWATGGNWAGGVPGAADDVIIDGGVNPPTINLSSAVTIKSLLIGLTTASTLTFQNGDVSTKKLIVTGDAIIGPNGTMTHVANAGTDAHIVNLRIAGNLRIDAGGGIEVSGQGLTAVLNDGRSGGTHGGQGGAGYDVTYLATPYGSVTNPVTSGSAGLYSGGTGPGGGVVVLNVTGTATINGNIYAKGYSFTASNGGGGAGGSINITANSIAGSGALDARGGEGFNNAAGGGGGRIAVVTAGSGFGALTMDTRGGGDGSDARYWGAGGTIYLKKAGDVRGTLLVDGKNVPQGSNNGLLPRTLIGPSVTDTVVGDVQLLNLANLQIASTCTLTVYGSWSNAVGPAALTGGGTVEFKGTGTNSVWGGNTWNNLTIATAGKTVNFEAGKTQTVFGAAAFSNVTLQSTSLNQWHLRKPGIGTQYVGRVTVYDSHAGTNTAEYMFWGAVGSEVSDPDNRNWNFTRPEGTVIMMR